MHIITLKKDAAQKDSWNRAILFATTMHPGQILHAIQYICSALFETKLVNWVYIIILCFTHRLEHMWRSLYMEIWVGHIPSKSTDLVNHLRGLYVTVESFLIFSCVFDSMVLENIFYNCILTTTLFCKLPLFIFVTWKLFKVLFVF
mgnify:CR=1 FL=1